MTGPVVESDRRTVYRVGRSPDPWQWIPWQYGPFGGRWDDPRQEYRVLYAAETKFTAYVEVLAKFRPDLSWLADLQEVEGDPDDQIYPTPAPGIVQGSWVTSRSLGRAVLAGRHLNLSAAGTLSWLRPLAARLMVRHGIKDMDGGAIRSSDRAFTQDLSRLAYDWNGEEAPMDGVVFESRHGDGLRVTATFERSRDVDMSGLLTGAVSTPLSEADPELEAAMVHHNLTYAPL